MRTEILGGLQVRICGGVDGEGGGNGPCVVLLHGFGAPGDDLVGLWRELDVPRATRFAFPAAPIEFSMGWGESRAWWMIDMERVQRALLTGRLHDLRADVPEGLDEARAALVAALDALEARLSVRPGQLVLGGFSQGAMLSLDVALRTERPLAGLLLLSGTIIAEGEWAPRMASRAGLRVFQSHGREDEILPFAIAEHLRDMLSEAGLAVDWVPFRGGHGITPVVLDRLGAFLRGLWA